MNNKKLNIWPLILLCIVVVTAVSVLSNSAKSDNYSYSAFLEDLNSAEPTVTSAIIEQNIEVRQVVCIFLQKIVLSAYLQPLILMKWQKSLQMQESRTVSGT